MRSKLVFSDCKVFYSASCCALTQCAYQSYRGEFKFRDNFLKQRRVRSPVLLSSFPPRAFSLSLDLVHPGSKNSRIVNKACGHFCYCPSRHAEAGDRFFLKAVATRENIDSYETLSWQRPQLSIHSYGMDTYVYIFSCRRADKPGLSWLYSLKCAEVNRKCPLDRKWHPRPTTEHK